MHFSFAKKTFQTTWTKSCWQNTDLAIFFKNTHTLNLPLQSKGNSLTGNGNVTPFPKKLVLQRELVFSNVFILYNLCSSKLKCLYKKTNSKWRLLKKNAGEKSLWLCIRKDFLDTTSAIQFIKEKTARFHQNFKLVLWKTLLRNKS